MADHRQDIPSWAFINAQIAQQAVHSGDLARSVRTVEVHYGLAPGSLTYINPAYTVSLLYCLIVVPKELWLHSDKHAVYDMIEEDWMVALFEVDKDDRGHIAKHPVFYLIHHLRNAIAHANFSIEDDGRFRFWDKANESPPYFCATISEESLQEFISKVGALLANLRTGLNNGRR